MKILTWSLAALLLAGMTARGDELSSKGNVERIEGQKVERLRATEAYYRKAGKVTSAEFYRAVADQAGKKAARLPTIYVPVIKSEGVSREESIRLTEVVINSIERESIYKVVGTPDEADLIFEGTLKPKGRPKP